MPTALPCTFPTSGFAASTVTLAIGESSTGNPTELFASRSAGWPEASRRPAVNAALAPSATCPDELKPDGIFVGQAMVLGTIEGTAWDNGNANLDGATVAAKLWELFRARNDVTVKIG